MRSQNSLTSVCGVSPPTLGPHCRARRRAEPPRDRMRKVVGLAERRRIARDRIFERAQRADAVDLRHDARVVERVAARAARSLHCQLDAGKAAVLRRIQAIGVLADADDDRSLRMRHDERGPSCTNRLPGRRRRFRRTGEALRHRHPLVRDFAAHAQRGVVDVARLRDDLAELHGRAFDAIALVGLVPRPPLARGTLQTNVRLLRRHRATAIRESPAEGVDAHDGDVANPVVLDAHAAEHVERGLSVRPRLHLARADAGTHAHVRAGPLHALRRIEARRIHRRPGARTHASAATARAPQQPRNQTRVYSTIERPDASEWEMLSQKEAKACGPSSVRRAA